MLKSTTFLYENIIFAKSKNEFTANNEGTVFETASCSSRLALIRIVNKIKTMNCNSLDSWTK